MAAVIRERLYNFKKVYFVTYFQARRGDPDGCGSVLLNQVPSEIIIPQSSGIVPVPVPRQRTSTVPVPVPQKKEEIKIVENVEPNLLKEENQLLTSRLNDLTEKLYNSEKNNKLYKKSLQRNKSLLKERDREIINKLNQLEIKLGISNTKTNVLDRMNEIESTLVNDTEWYKCGSCTQLELELKDRDEKLILLENELEQLERNINLLDSVKINYNKEIQDIKVSLDAFFF